MDVPAQPSTSSRHLPPLVLAPGLLCDARLWGPVRARLAAPSCDVDFADAGSLEEMADAILAGAPPRFVLAGFSMGGMAAILAAAGAPERVAAVAILATHAEVDTPERARARLEQMAEAEGDGFPDLVTRLKPAYFAEPRAHPAERALVAEMAHAQGADLFTRHVRAILERPDLGAAARTIRVPAHVVAGADDRIAPPELGRRLAALIPGAALTILPACGHLAPLEAPDAVAALLDELAASVALQETA